MRKSDKKLDKAIRNALNDACEAALERRDGFQWLTHEVNYQAFPASLRIVCIYETEQQLSSADTAWLRGEIKSRLQAIDIKLTDAEKHISFDSEQACEREHGGNWARRLGAH